MRFVRGPARPEGPRPPVRPCDVLRGPSRRAARLRPCAQLAIAAAVVVGGGACEVVGARRDAQLGVEAYKAGRFEEAHERFTRALAVEADFPTTRLNQGFVCLQLTKVGAPAKKDEYARCAIDAFRAYEKLVPADKRGRDYVLHTFADTLRYDDALAYFEPELARTPPSMEAMAVLGQIAAKKGDLENAKTWCKRRAEAAPSDPNAQACLGSLIWEHLHKKPTLPLAERVGLADEGIAAMKRAIELAPDVPDRYVFANLLHRERALGHCAALPPDFVLPAEPPPVPRPKRGQPAEPVRFPNGLTYEEQLACNAARQADVDEATRLLKLGMEKGRAQAKAKTSSASATPAAKGT
jgi:tetratricopeptide (TPR) repeat protein